MEKGAENPEPCRERRTGSLRLSGVWNAYDKEKGEYHTMKKIESGSLAVMLDEETLGLRIEKDGVVWNTDPKKTPELIFAEGTYRFLDAEEISHEVYSFGVGCGIRSRYAGFAGTPYIAFALADNGYVEDAYKLIQNTDCPSWLYTVKAGGTTVWERWDALDENGHFKGADSIADMVSFNHYAYGAVGDFYYRRILGIEAITAGYGRFAVRPLPGGTLSWAEGSVDTVYGKIAVRWELVEGVFRLSVTVPANTECIVTMPGNSTHAIGSGEYEFQEDI